MVPATARRNSNKVVVFGVVGLAVLIWVIIGLAVSGGNSSQSDASVHPPHFSSAIISPTADQPFDVVDWKWNHGEYGGTYIVGTVKNKTDKHYGYVQIEFNLYDKSGAQVGNAIANLNNLEPRGVWRFKAIVIDDERVASARLKGVSGF